MRFFSNDLFGKLKYISYFAGFIAMATGPTECFGDQSYFSIQKSRPIELDTYKKFIAELLSFDRVGFLRWQIPIVVGFSKNYPENIKKRWVSKIKEVASKVGLPVTFSEDISVSNIKIEYSDDMVGTVLSYKYLLNHDNSLSDKSYLEYAKALTKWGGVIEVMLPAERSLAYALIITPNNKTFLADPDLNIDYGAYLLICGCAHSNFISPSIFNVPKSKPGRFDDAVIRAEYDYSVSYREEISSAVEKIAPLAKKYAEE